MVAISVITGCECMLWLSYSLKKNKKLGFCISLAMTCQVSLFKCSEQFLTVSRSYQKQSLFFFFSPERSIFKERENLLQAHKHSVDMHIFLLIVMEYKRTKVELETSDMHFLNSQAKLECVGLKDLSPFLYRK